MENPEKPPLFKSWTGWYVLILAVLIVQIILYRLLTLAFA
jgi:hypothetical protein